MQCHTCYNKISHSYSLVIAEEDRTKKDPHVGKAWMHFGGRKQHADGETRPEITAINNFITETGAVFESRHVDLLYHMLYHQDTLKLFYGSCKYVLFVPEIPYSPNTPSKFTRLCRNNKSISSQTSTFLPPSVVQTGLSHFYSSLSSSFPIFFGCFISHSLFKQIISASDG